ncbi:MAG: ABC transporter permease subunit, partial [Thermoplasmatota archaeon]
PYHVSLRAAETKDLRVRIRNTGDEVLSIDLESLLMPIYDWYWDIEVSPLFDRDENPTGEIQPGEEMEYLLRISAGYYSEKMPYNLLLLATDGYREEYSLSRPFHVIVNIEGGPEEPGIGEEFHEILWGGEIRYERFMWIIMLTAVAGSGLISNDLKNNTLTLYLSRPITWKEYIFGKFLALSFLLSLITIVPTILLFLAEVAFRDVSLGYILGNIPVLGGMLLAYVITVALFSSVALALSSSTRRWIFAGVGIFAYFIFTPPVGDLLADLFENEHFRLLNINYVLKITFKPLFGLDFDADGTGFGYYLPVLVMIVILLGSWAIVYNRFKGKEVAQ